MPQLSQHYRNDADGGIDPSMRQYLDTRYLAKLKNLHYANPKLLVVFSGGNAVGKTTIARKIEAKFHGLVVENDEIKRYLLTMQPGIDRDSRNKITWQYTITLYQRLQDITPNGLVVRDGIIDWYYDRILPIFERAGYEFFIIGFDISPEKALELIKKRGDTQTTKADRLYKLLEDHAIHTKRFRQLYTPDIILTDNNLFGHELVMQKLEQKLQKLANR